MQNSKYKKFPAIDTIALYDYKDIDHAISRAVDHYIINPKEFSFRVLLPRDGKANQKAKRIGFEFQAKLVLNLKKIK